MKLNKYLWEIYKNSAEGKKAIKQFDPENPELNELLSKYLGEYSSTPDQACNFIMELDEYCSKPKIPKTLNGVEGLDFFLKIIEKGFELKYPDGEVVKFDPDKNYFLYFIPILSTWLYLHYPTFYKPCFFLNRFHLLTQITDQFGIEIPPIPPKRDKLSRMEFYYFLCNKFILFQEENNLSDSEFCAFLYDFAPNYISQSQEPEKPLPKPTQVWMVGGDKFGGDFEFLDKPTENAVTFWQGNVDTKRGDIIIMYCLSPRSCVHSVWRATADGIADPFFQWYSNIYIGNGIKVEPITLEELKADSHFSKHPLVRKNMQGVNGWQISSEDYQRLQEMIVKKGGNIKKLPQLYSHTFKLNKSIKNEKSVETSLIEPLLEKLGYSSDDWIRQLPVKMGRGERNFPDYSFLTKKEKGYEEVSMLLEAKYYIKNNKELEDTFRQVWSYGQRLRASILIIADKDAIWIYERHNDSFDRSQYIKIYWKELENPNEFLIVKKLIGTGSLAIQ